MRARIIRALFILMCSIWFGVTFLILGIDEHSFELAVIGPLIMLAGATVSYLHLTYKDDDNKYW